MDYIVRDSSLRQDAEAFGRYDYRDNAIRVGMVRGEVEANDGTTRYLVEVLSGGNQIPVSCALMTRFGGPYNFEEYRLKPWASKVPGGALPPGTAGRYSLRDGDVVLVAFLDGKAREGVILGGLQHPVRANQTNMGELAYISTYNGVETKIESSGSYTVTFNGAPLQDQSPVPTTIPGLAEVSGVQYNPLIAGSFYGFDENGSFTVSDGNNQNIVIEKNPIAGTLTITSGNSSITMSGTAVLGEMAVSTNTLNIETTLATSVAAKTEFSVDTLNMKLKGTKVAIGNDVIELFDGLVQLIDKLGTLQVTSPVGTCTPLSLSPTWAQVEAIKLKLSTIKGAL